MSSLDYDECSRVGQTNSSRFEALICLLLKTTCRAEISSNRPGLTLNEMLKCSLCETFRLEYLNSLNRNNLWSKYSNEAEKKIFARLFPPDYIIKEKRISSSNEVSASGNRFPHTIFFVIVALQQEVFIINLSLWKFSINVSGLQVFSCRSWKEQRRCLEWKFTLVILVGTLWNPIMSSKTTMVNCANLVLSEWWRNFVQRCIKGKKRVFMAWKIVKKEKINNQLCRIAGRKIFIFWYSNWQ